MMGLFSNANNDQQLKLQLASKLNGSTVERLKRLQRLKEDLEVIQLIEKLQNDCTIDRIVVIGSGDKDITVNIVNNEIVLTQKV